jgi:hypothetical protein
MHEPILAVPLKDGEIDSIMERHRKGMATQEDVLSLLMHVASLEPESAAPLSAAELNFIRGKYSAGKATQPEIGALFAHIDVLEALLDEGDGEDAFGTEGWRHRLGIDE